LISSQEEKARPFRRFFRKLLIDDLLTERQAEQPEPVLDPELEALLPF